MKFNRLVFVLVFLLNANCICAKKCDAFRTHGDSIFFEFENEGNYFVDVSSSEFTYLSIVGKSGSNIRISDFSKCSNCKVMVKGIRISNLDSLLLQDRITELDIENNQFCDQLPSSLQGVKKLSVLNVVSPIDFNLSNSLILGSLNLDHLSIRQLKKPFRNVDFSFLSNLQGLKSLFISFDYRHFEEFKNCLNSCTNLNYLEIWNCGSVTKSIDFSNLKLVNLTYLITNGKYRKGPQINCFFPNLRTVEINLDFSKAFPDFVFSNIGIEHLEIHACEYRFYDFKRMESNLTNLKSLGIYLSGFGRDQIAELNSTSPYFQNKVKFFNHSHVTYN